MFSRNNVLYQILKLNWIKQNGENKFCNFRMIITYNCAQRVKSAKFWKNKIIQPAPVIIAIQIYMSRYINFTQSKDQIRSK